MFSKTELETYRQAFAAYGAELHDYTEGKCIVLRFPSTAKMLTLIDEITAIDKRFAFNSKKQADGGQLLTISGR